MTPDRIEAALRSEIPAREREFIPRPLPPTVMEARASLAQRRTPNWALMMAAAVAAVGVVVVIGWAASRAIAPNGGLDIGDGPTASATAPATPMADGRCTAADFAVTSDPWDAGAGSRGTRVIFRVVDSVDECTLGGSLGARIVDATGAVLVEGTSDPMADTQVTGGTQLEIGVSWSNWCGADPARPIEVSVTLAGDGTAIPLVPPAGSEVLVPPCMGSGQGSVLNVTPFEPSTRPPPEG
ncbi:MAG TPA: hypothetical protein VJ975_02735 [Candidatus Limnocylindria bacterium]|nr:hypothetical protein [Candidatus Limnocylindria bacterium]